MQAHQIDHSWKKSPFPRVRSWFDSNNTMCGKERQEKERVHNPPSGSHVVSGCSGCSGSGGSSGNSGGSGSSGGSGGSGICCGRDRDRCRGRGKPIFEINLKGISEKSGEGTRGNRNNSSSSRGKEDKLKMIINKCSEMFEERIYISDYKFVLKIENMERKKITHIINAAGYECTNVHNKKHFSYRTYYLNDDSNDDVFYVLLDSYYFITNTLRTNESSKILIHCNKGISRSVIIVIFFLMNKLQLNYFEAFKMVKEKRKLSNPNVNYITQLLNMFKWKEDIKIRNDDNKVMGTFDEDKELPHEKLSQKRNSERTVFLFRIDGMGDELFPTNVISQGCNKESSTSYPMLTPIDERFNYILIANFEDYYLLLFDDTWEDVYNNLFHHFVLISTHFFQNTTKNQCTIRSDISTFIEKHRSDFKTEHSIPSCDQLYLNVCRCLQRGCISNMRTPPLVRSSHS
ncbi:protein tyrosine phosphatase, putative [Plasmodium ovale]|uniref:Protein tyrosine phosphatase, putative n=2 Tax=Plasmodium ovale TaxID=36330 RepID=A0A1D3KYX8_PLAOA|nr:protein tyrosine phosphatase, putative (PTP2) [Plasmodium ovale curtisi]SBS89204.1 protein tyrosine phosphatase, putative (PTP2) [Plasmodium ovale curtisi]SCD22394.1 protein tyrosine phosphatase, putative [Plasmodium ovale]